MDQRQRIGLFFIISGLSTGAVAIFGIAPEIGSIDAGQSELSAVIILSISLGFVVTGCGWYWNYPRHLQMPSLVLGGVGVAGVGGGLVVFRPWQYAGLAGGLRTLITGVFVVVGGGLALSGSYWFRQREYRYPLALLAGLLSLGLFYLAHQRLDLLMAIPVLALVVAVVVAGPIIAVLFQLDSDSEFDN
jgi:hypothetical protein